LLKRKNNFLLAQHKPVSQELTYLRFILQVPVDENIKEVVAWQRRVEHKKNIKRKTYRFIKLVNGLSHYF